MVKPFWRSLNRYLPTLMLKFCVLAIFNLLNILNLITLRLLIWTLKHFLLFSFSVTNSFDLSREPLGDCLKYVYCGDNFHSKGERDWTRTGHQRMKLESILFLHSLLQKKILAYLCYLLLIVFSFFINRCWEWQDPYEQN